MARARKQVGDGDVLVSAILPVHATVRAIGADILPEPAPSPARELQLMLQESTGDLRLPQLSSSNRSLPLFVMSAVLLWGGTLGGIAGLMALLR